MEEFDLSLLQDNYTLLATAAGFGGLTVPGSYEDVLQLTVAEGLTLLDDVVGALEALEPSVFQGLLDNPLFADQIPAEALPFIEQLAAGDTSSVTGLVGQASGALSGYGPDTVLADIVDELGGGGGTVDVPADIAQTISDAQETLSTLLWQTVGAAGAAFESPIFSVDDETGAWSVTGEGGAAYDGADLAALYATVGDAVSNAVLDFLAGNDAVLQSVVDGGVTSADLEAAAAAGQAAAQAAAERIQSFADLLAGAYDPAQVSFDAEAAAAALRDAYADALPAIGGALSGLIFGTRNSDPTFVVEFDGAATGSERDDRFYLTEGDDSFDAGAGADIVFGLDGDDTLEGGAGDDALFGGDGVDRAVFDGAAGDHLIQIVAGETPQVVVSGKAEGPGTDTLTDMEELEFGDGFSFHPDGAPLVDLTLWTGLFDGPVEITPGEMAVFAQMYIAYFDRAPDVSGLLYWSERLSEGMTMAEIASSFFDQPESRALYPDPEDDAALVTAVYNNYLERDPDAGGEAYWLDQLARDDYNRGQFMLDIISGTTGPDGSAADAALVADKGDIGIYYSAIAGLNDPVGLALDVMDAYDRTDPAASLAAAQGLIDEARSAAEAPGSGTEIIELVGFIDDPFAVA